METMRIVYDQIIGESDQATRFNIAGEKVWIPHSVFEFDEDPVDDQSGVIEVKGRGQGKRLNCFRQVVMYLSVGP